MFAKNLCSLYIDSVRVHNFTNYNTLSHDCQASIRVPVKLRHDSIMLISQAFFRYFSKKYHQKSTAIRKTAVL